MDQMKVTIPVSEDMDIYRVRVAFEKCISTQDWTDRLILWDDRFQYSAAT